MLRLLPVLKFIGVNYEASDHFFAGFRCCVYAPYKRDEHIVNCYHAQQGSSALGYESIISRSVTNRRVFCLVDDSFNSNTRDKSRNGSQLAKLKYETIGT